MNMRIEHIVHEGRGYSMMTPEELAAAGVPEAVVLAHLSGRIVDEQQAAIDRICDGLYTASPSRDARYNNKYDEAIRYRDANYPANVAEAEYPTLANEAPKRGLTKRQLSDVIIARRDAFNLIGGKAEAARAEIETAVAAAATIDAKRAAAAAVVAGFAALAAGA